MAIDTLAVTPAAVRSERGRIELDVVELMARYTRAVDGLAFERLVDVFEADATVRYCWLPVDSAGPESVHLRGLDAIQSWLRARLAGRPHLRRFVSNPELLGWTPGAAAVRIAMHERDMRITGTYQVHAVRQPAGWRIRRLDLAEQIHH